MEISYLIFILFVISVPLAYCLDEYPKLRGSPGASNNLWWDDLEVRLKKIDYDFGDIYLYYNFTNKRVTHRTNNITLVCVNNEELNKPSGIETHIENLCPCTNFVLKKRLKVKKYEGNYEVFKNSSDESPFVDGSKFYNDNNLYDCKSGTWMCPCTYTVDCTCYYGSTIKIFLIFGILCIIFGSMGIPTLGFIFCSSNSKASKVTFIKIIWVTIAFDVLLVIIGIILIACRDVFTASICGSDSEKC